MREIVLYIAMSLDGYIADSNDDVNWLGGHDKNSEELGSYPKFIENIDTVILGYKTYYKIISELSPNNWPYTGKKSYVLTHRAINNTDEIEFTCEDIKSLILKLKQQEGNDIWICGGANIINQLLRNDLIDKFQITIIPTILGNGIRLFEQLDVEKQLKLISTENYNGMVDLIYKPRD